MFQRFLRTNGIHNGKLQGRTETYVPIVQCRPVRRRTREYDYRIVLVRTEKIRMKVEEWVAQCTRDETKSPDAMTWGQPDQPTTN